MVHAGLHIRLKPCRFVGSIPTRVTMSRTHIIVVEEKDWKDSKYRTREWEKRVNIIRWEHDFEEKVYKITIKVKK